MHRLPIEDRLQAVLLEDHNIPLAFPNLGNGFLVLGLLLKRVAADHVLVGLNLPATGSVGKAHDQRRQIIDVGVAVADEKHFQRRFARMGRHPAGDEE